MLFCSVFKLHWKQYVLYGIYLVQSIIYAHFRGFGEWSSREIALPELWPHVIISNIYYVCVFGGCGPILRNHSWPGACCADQTGFELAAPLRLCCHVGPYDQDVTGRKPVLFLVIIKYVEYLLFGTRMMIGTMLVIIIFGLMRCRLKRVVCQCLARTSCPRYKGNGDQRCLMNSWGCSWLVKSVVCWPYADRFLWKS